MSRILAPSVNDSLKGGFVIGFPCVLKYANVISILFKEINCRKSY